MTFNIIGTGNIAWFFGSRLLTGRHQCTGVYARNRDAAQVLAESLLSPKFDRITEIEDGEADVCFLAVSDSAIPKVAELLSFKKTILVHTAGAVDIESLKNAARQRAVLWPVYSIVKTNPPNHRNIPCAWEASSESAQKMLLTMGHAITDILFEAKYEQRKWLHLSAVIGNNFVNHLLAICEQICTENSLPFSTLMPIIEQTFDRIRQSSPQTLQTGPAVRGDSTTIQEQVALLRQHPAWQNVYSSITESIQASTKNNI